MLWLYLVCGDWPKFQHEVDIDAKAEEPEVEQIKKEEQEEQEVVESSDVKEEAVKVIWVDRQHAIFFFSPLFSFRLESV